MSFLSIALFLGTFVLSLWASARGEEPLHSLQPGRRVFHATGAQVAAAILQRAGIRDVEIVAEEGMLGDHYDPAHKRLVLSAQNYQSNSLAAIGVAAHECGHALQHQQAYAPLHLRMAAVGATQFASQIVMWLPLLGIFTGIFSGYTGFAIMGRRLGRDHAFQSRHAPRGIRRLESRQARARGDGLHRQR
ncbi:MAG: zinc metallopeptidase [Chthoniobacter sp.]